MTAAIPFVSRYPEARSEFRENLVRPDMAIDSLPSFSKDQCRWVCRIHRHEWIASPAARLQGGRRGGCPRCAAELTSKRRRVAAPDVRLAVVAPELATVAVRNVTHPEVRPGDLATASNQRVEWLCQCGLTFVLPVWAAVKAGRPICRVCRRNGKSRAEYETAEVLRVLTGFEVQTHHSFGPRLEVDLFLPQFQAAIDLDPYSTHRSRCAVDLEKVTRIRERVPLATRIRDARLPSLEGCISLSGPVEPRVAASVIAQWLGVEVRAVDEDQVRGALQRANRSWDRVLHTPPQRNLTTRVDLLAEFESNLTHPGRDPRFTPLACGDRIAWRCSTCNHSWSTDLAHRTGPAPTGCPRCATSRRAESKSQPAPGESLADLAPWLAAEFLRNVSNPNRLPSSLKPMSQDRVLWSCSRCGGEWESSVQNRYRVGRQGCRRCNTLSGRAAVRARRIRRVGSLGDRPDLAGEFVRNLTHPGCEPSTTPLACRDRVLWRCKVCTHEWEAVVSARAKGERTQCPKCSKRRAGLKRSVPPVGRSLATRVPALSAQFVGNLSHPGRGPDQLYPQSLDLCSWRCDECGCIWTKSVANQSRVKSTGCGAHGGGRERVPVEKSLSAVAPALASQLVTNVTHPFHSDANRLSARSGDVCRWRCPDCGSEWEASVRSRTSTKYSVCGPCAQRRRGAACTYPTQGRSLAERVPSLAAEFVRNLTRPDRGPDTLFVNAPDLVLWRCCSCGATWENRVRNRFASTTHEMCPACARSARAALSAPARTDTRPE